MKVLCIGDPHFTENASHEMDGFTAKSLELIDKLSDLSLVVVLGDVLDRFEKANLSVHTQAMKWLYEISTRVKLLILIGNHDRINNKVFLSDESFFWACQYWPNVILADKVKYFTIDNFQFVGVPYVEPGRFNEALDTVENWQTVNAIFAHQEMKGCSLGIVKSESGDSWQLEWPLLISGHIHEYERLQQNMVYVGTPRMKTFGDKKKKTVSIFTFDVDGGTSKKNMKWTEERISLELPKKISITFTINELTSATDFLKITDDLTGNLRILVQGTASELAIGMKHPIVKHLRKIGAKIITDEISVGAKESSGESGGEIGGESDGGTAVSKVELKERIWKKISQDAELSAIMKSLLASVKLKITPN